MAIPPLIGNPYNGYINPYYWVDDHPLLYGNNGSLDNPDVRASLSSVVTWPLTQVVGTNHNKQQKYQSPRDNIFSVITGGMKRRCTSKKRDMQPHDIPRRFNASVVSKLQDNVCIASPPGVQHVVPKSTLVVIILI